MKKVKELAVKIGEYTDNGGNKKARWKNVGIMMQDDKGGQFLMLERSFNPAGVPFKDGSESIMISLFDPKVNGQTQQSAPTVKQEVEDDIAF